MLTWEDDVEVHALRKRGWSISAIARHTGHDRKTVRYAEFGITDLMPYRSLCRIGVLAVRPNR
jgi:transposase